MLYVAEMQPGISDGAVLDLANQGAMLLLTADKDLAEVVAGAIRDRAEEIGQAFTIIMPGIVRIRRKKSGPW